MKRNDNNIKFVPKLVTACCALRNLCEQYGGACEEEWIVHPRGIDDRAQVPTATPSASLSTSSATRIREALCDFFLAMAISTLPAICSQLAAFCYVVWLARLSHLTARGAKGKGRSSGSND